MATSIDEDDGQEQQEVSVSSTNRSASLSTTIPSPSTPVADASWGSPKSPPALPQRKLTAGSVHTTYVPPSPQPTGSLNGTWREPVLIQEDETLPSFDSSDASRMWSSFSHPDWNLHSGANAQSTWESNYDEDVKLVENTLTVDSMIDGRDDHEEVNWWNPSVGVERPGQGMLPSLLAEELHHPEHSLFTVTVTPLDISPNQSASSGAGPPSSPPSSPPTSQRSNDSSSSTSHPFAPPSREDCLQAVPHPNAFYCRRHNGWIILVWKSSTILPPLASSFLRSPHPPLPDQARRKRIRSCLDGSPNKTHHFHKYEKAVDAKNMSSPYIARPWEKSEMSKTSRRRITVGNDYLQSEKVAYAVDGDLKSQVETQMATDSWEEEQSQYLMDLYVCCQCSLYVLVSDVIPGVIPLRYVEEFTLNKGKNPEVGRTAQESVQSAWQVVMSTIENKLWKGNNRSLHVGGRLFTAKVGWSPIVRKIFESLGFEFAQKETQTLLIPPNTDTSSEEGRKNKERLLRAWVEIGTYVAEYRRRFPNVAKDREAARLHVKIESAREMYQTAVGSHPDQMKRGQLPESLAGLNFLDDDWRILGLTQSTYDPDLVQFAYLAQCRCDPKNTPQYFQRLTNIVNTLRNAGTYPSDLDTLVASEHSRGRFTMTEFDDAKALLGFGSDNWLRLDYDEDVEDEFIRRAWRDAIRRSWNESDGSTKRRELNDAIKILAEGRNSLELAKAWNDEVTNGMTPDRAYSTLGVPEGVDEEMLITVYNMRVEDQPSQLDRMRDAIRVIAEFTASERLQKFVETGSDPGVVVAPTRPDWPRGLNQLGNTCYLNSLLQYFYTIKDLREAISPMIIGDELTKFSEAGTLKDDDLKNHRVGGRVVTRHEVIRSRKFVTQLATLFWDLENSDTPAVTPTLELAKLALVTSKDEEEEDFERGGTDSSNSTDATLVDDPLPATTLRESPQPASPVASSPSPTTLPGNSSVLGKRPRGFGRKRTEASNSVDSTHIEEIDKDKDGYVLVSKVSQASTDNALPSGSNTPVRSKELNVASDIEMQDATSGAATGQAVSKVPPLPPRPKTQSSGSDMMFGKQHDVAECMDNCMFQMETALLKFGELAGSDDSKRSIVKRLFYGKIRQRLSMAPDPSRSKSSTHEREDYFSHLPVNVSEESFDLYDGLSGFFDDVVEYEGTKAKMEVSLIDLPPILQIQLQRVQFNRETLQPYKSHAYVKFGETISMDRFLDDAPVQKKQRSKEIQAELNACRERIQQLTQCKPAAFETSLRDTYNFLTEQKSINLPEVTSELTNTLASEDVLVTDEITACRARASELKQQLEEVWQDENRAEYELTSVFVHRGASPSFGHYFIYQRWLPDHKDEWFKYNDSDVSTVTKEEVLADTTGSTANPYLLVFARKGSQIIQTVHRADPMSIEQ